jgi:hypothetical protein
MGISFLWRAIFVESPFLLLVGMKDSPIVPVVVGVHLLDKVHIISP